MLLTFTRFRLCWGGLVLLMGCEPEEEEVVLPTSDPPTEITGGSSQSVELDESDLDCSASIESHTSTGCDTHELECGSSVIARLGGGGSTFGDDFYEAMRCTAIASGYDGPDAVYSLQIPESTEAIVRLESPCAELHLASFRWEDRTRCPTAEGTAHACEMDTRSDNPEIKITSIKPERNLIIVDGESSSNSVYRLSVTCNGEYR